MYYYYLFDDNKKYLFDALGNTRPAGDRGKVWIEMIFSFFFFFFSLGRYPNWRRDGWHFVQYKVDPFMDFSPTF